MRLSKRVFRHYEAKRDACLVTKPSEVLVWILIGLARENIRPSMFGQLLKPYNEKSLGGPATSSRVERVSFENKTHSTLIK